MPLPVIPEPLNQKDIIYFVLTDRFYNPAWDTPGGNGLRQRDPNFYHGGSFAGIAAKIPYLRHLGITALWITPVYLSIGSFLGQDGYHGYWALDFDQIDPHLLASNREPASSGRDQLAHLVKLLHDSGIKVILDMVVNHTGYHTAGYFRQSKIPSDWFKKKEEWDLFGLPRLDHRKADVRDYFVNNVIDWIEATGIDAIRMDSVPHIDREFWYYFKAYVRGKYRHIFFLGEDLEFDEELIAAYQREHDFDSLFDFPLRRNIVDVMIRNEDFKPREDRLGMAAIASPRLKSPASPQGVLDVDHKYNNANRLVTLLDNHDLDRRIMSWAAEYAREKAGAADLVRYVLTFQFTTRGIPQVYYGTELGMAGDQAHGGDDAVRQDMAWDMVDPQTLEPMPAHAEAAGLFHHLRELVRIRKENEALSFGYLFTVHSSYNYYAFMREFRGNTLITAMNNSWNSGRFQADITGNENIPSRIKQNLLARGTLVNLLDKSQRVTCRDGRISWDMPPKTAGIFRLEE